MFNLDPAAEARETPRILSAVSRTERRIRAHLRLLFESRGLTYPPGDVFLRVFKLEESLELWARNGSSGPFTRVKTYRAFNIPLTDLEKRIAELDPDRPIAIVCRSGYRSSAAASILEGQGFPNVANVAGGTQAWISSGFQVDKAAV